MVDAQPTYGYRRVIALLKRAPSLDGEINHKRVYRPIKKHGLLLARHTGHGRQ